MIARPTYIWRKNIAHLYISVCCNVYNFHCKAEEEWFEHNNSFSYIWNVIFFASTPDAFTPDLMAAVTIHSIFLLLFIPMYIFIFSGSPQIMKWYLGFLAVGSPQIKYRSYLHDLCIWRCTACEIWVMMSSYWSVIILTSRNASRMGKSMLNFIKTGALCMCDRRHSPHMISKSDCQMETK